MLDRLNHIGDIPRLREDLHTERQRRYTIRRDALVYRQNIAL
jgi:hypothetical protein